MSEPLTKAQIIERDVPHHVREHPLYRWLRHDDRCAARQMTMDMTAVDGPCNCGLYDAARQSGDYAYVETEMEERIAALRAALASHPTPFQRGGITAAIREATPVPAGDPALPTCNHGCDLCEQAASIGVSQVFVHSFYCRCGCQNKAHIYKGENLALCGTEIPDVCPDCQKIMQDG